MTLQDQHNIHTLLVNIKFNCLIALATTHVRKARQGLTFRLVFKTRTNKSIFSYNVCILSMYQSQSVCTDNISR